MKEDQESLRCTLLGKCCCTLDDVDDMSFPSKVCSAATFEKADETALALLLRDYVLSVRLLTGLCLSSFAHWDRTTLGFSPERRDSYQGTPVSCEKPVEGSLRGAKTDAARSQRPPPRS